MGENRKDIDSFAANNPIGFPLLLDVDMAVATAWSVKGLPTTYILDQNGQIVYQVLGDRDWDDPTVLQQVRALREPSQPL
jgi:peroxiredoxin